MAGESHIIDVPDKVLSSFYNNKALDKTITILKKVNEYKKNYFDIIEKKPIKKNTEDECNENKENNKRIIHLVYNRSKNKTPRNPSSYVFHNEAIVKRLTDIENNHSDMKIGLYKKEKLNIPLNRFSHDSKLLKRSNTMDRQGKKSSFEDEEAILIKTRNIHRKKEVIDLNPQFDLKSPPILLEKADQLYEKVFQKNLFYDLGLKQKFEKPVKVRNQIIKSKPQQVDPNNYILSKIDKMKNVIYYVKSVVDYTYAKITVDKFKTARDILNNLKQKDIMEKKINKEFSPENFYITSDIKKLNRQTSQNTMNVKRNTFEMTKVNFSKDLKNSVSENNFKIRNNN